MYRRQKTNPELNSRLKFLKANNNLPNGSRLLFKRANLFGNLLNSKRSQVAIFVILALIIVVTILMLFLFFRKPIVEVEDVENPQAYIDSCVKENTDEAIEILSKHGGDINPEGSVMYKGENITYLCYTATYYKTCVNQRPMLIEHIESEIQKYIEPKVNGCFNSLKTELEKNNYIVEMGKMSLTVSLKPKQTVVDIKRNLRATKRDKTQEFQEFKTTISTPIYDLAKIAMGIVNDEAQYCNFEILGFMLLYPEYSAQKTRLGDPDTIYELIERRTNKNFIFAIRSCPMPPGF